MDIILEKLIPKFLEGVRVTVQHGKAAGCSAQALSTVPCSIGTAHRARDRRESSYGSTETLDKRQSCISNVLIVIPKKEF